MNYWLLKTEPTTYSIHDLAAEAKQTTCWDGVRNYQARNFMRDEMKRGDRVLIYHSNANPAAIVGTATIVKAAYPDSTALDRHSKYYDPKSTADEPRWVMVDVKLERIFDEPLELPFLRSQKLLQKMELLRKGSRLSVQPVRPSEFGEILKLAAS
ncbi:MAG: EVE domain-containing protein [Planctomycetales bacterium]|nr:EVE domain-containing protein [Planctomycetales bacterium]